MLTQISIPIHAREPDRIATARRHLKNDRLLFAAQQLQTVFEDIGRDDLINRGPIDRARICSALEYCSGFMPGRQLPANRSGITELAHDLERLAQFTERASKSAVQPRWHLGELVLIGKGWHLSHGRIGPNAGRYWRGFEEPISERMLARARYGELRIALDHEGCGEGPPDTLTTMPLRLHGWSGELLEKLAAFLTRLSREVQS